MLRGKTLNLKGLLFLFALLSFCTNGCGGTDRYHPPADDPVYYRVATKDIDTPEKAINELQDRIKEYGQTPTVDKDGIYDRYDKTSCLWKNVKDVYINDIHMGGTSAGCFFACLGGGGVPKGNLGTDGDFHSYPIIIDCGKGKANVKVDFLDDVERRGRVEDLYLLIKRTAELNK